MRNADVQRVLEALIDVWFDELARGGKIEIQNFLVLETKTVRRSAGRLGELLTPQGKPVRIPPTHREVKLRASKALRQRLNKRKKT